MMLDEQDWRGEHLIRCAPRQVEPEMDVPENKLDLRCKKAAKLINLHLTAPDRA